MLECYLIFKMAQGLNGGLPTSAKSLHTNVVALSETRILNGGRIDKARSGYSIWKGKLAPESQIYRVGFVVRTSLVHAHNLLPKVINEHLMSLHIPLSHDNFMTIISVYAPTFD